MQSENDLKEDLNHFIILVQDLIYTTTKLERYKGNNHYRNSLENQLKKFNRLYQFIKIRTLSLDESSLEENFQKTENYIRIILDSKDTKKILEGLKNIERIWPEIEICYQQANKGKETLDYFKLLRIHPEIVKSSKKLFEDGHYSQAIFEAYKKVNILVKNKSGRNDLDGKKLMLEVFSLNSPILRFNDLLSIGDKDEQEGFMHLFAGAIQGVRNPKGHEEIIQKDPIRTIEYIVYASLLCKRLEETKNK